VAIVSRSIQEAYRYLTGTPLRSLARLPLIAPFRNRIATWVRRWDLTRDVHGVELTMPGSFLNFYTDNFEPSTLQWLRENLRPGMIVADVGAHIGFVTVFMARLVGSGGRVYAFEPTSDSLAYLNRNVSQNGVQNVIIIPAAAGETADTRTLYLSGVSDTNSLYQRHLGRTVGTLQVEQVRLDDVVSAPDLVKIDVEGAEIEVLKGMNRILDQGKRPILLVEWSPACQVGAARSPDDLITTLRSLGYELKVLGDSASVDETVHRLARNELPQEWYVNLACLPNS
jgi:FkbM family methyltransferase